MLLNLIIFTILIVFTAFFVASEFAMVKMRPSRVDQLVSEGKKGAKSAHEVVNNLDAYLSACQLGITVTALGIGMVGESTFEHLLHPLFEYVGLSSDLIPVFTLAGAFAIATFLHVVVGELAPKTAALQKAEAITLLFSRPLILFYRIMYPFIWLLNGSAQLLVGVFGMKVAGHGDIYSSDELKLLMQESSAHGEISEKEYEYVNNILSLSDIVGKDIMVPRTEISMLNGESCLTDVLEEIEDSEYTRYPVYKDSKDNLLGYVNIKEIYKNYRLNKDMKVKHLVNDILFLIETFNLDEIFKKMQSNNQHMMILVDEYGGVSGLVTMEDILEELVGEIRDEYDSEEKDDIEIIECNEGIKTYEVEGKVLISELEELLGINILDEAEELNTIGGLFLQKEVDEFIIENHSFKIIERESMSIKRVQIIFPVVEETGL